MLKLELLIASVALACGFVPQTTIAQDDRKPPVEQREERQVQCLADNIWHEAGNQSTQGKIAVAHVVMNRVHSGRFGNDACAVIHQRTRGTCQFSWVCHGNKPVRDPTIAAENRRLAAQVLNGHVPDNTGGAMFYHAAYVNPHWKLRQVARIGAHVFYRG